MGKGGGGRSKLAHEVLELIEKGLQKLRKRGRGGREGAGHGPHHHGGEGPGGGHNTRDGSGRGSARSHTGDKPRDHAVSSDKRNCRNDPVDVASGAVVLSQTDISLPGVLPLLLKRMHLSTYQVGGWFGRTWASTLDMRVEVDTDGVVFASEDGMLLVYPSPSAGEPVLPVEGPRWPMERAGAGYTVTDPQRGWTWHFAAPPGSVPEAADGVQTLPIAAITNQGGDRIDVWYTTDGTVDEVRHSGGYRVGVDTADGRITTLRLANPRSDTDETLVRFSYNHLGHLTGVTNSSGLPLRFDYDEAGRLTRWTDRNSCDYGYVYDADGRCVRNTGTGGLLNGIFVYKPAVTTFTDGAGHRTVFHLNEQRQTVAELDPLGHETRWVWDRYDRLLSEIDPLGRATTYAYDDAGNLTTLTRPDGSMVQATYNQWCRPTVVTDADGAATRWEYDEQGNVAARVDPAGALTRYTYNARGHLASVTDPMDNTTTIGTDAAGLALTVTDPAGAVTTLARDHAGRVITITDPLGAVTRFGYTLEGKPAWRTGPDGATETWVFDGEGNLTTHIDPTGATTRFEYTHFDLLSARTDPDGARLEFGYDTELRLTQVTNPQGLNWTYGYDPAGRLVAETDFNDRTLTYTHDAAGQLLARTNGLGETTSYTRDALGTITTKHAPDGQTRYFHDPVGRLLRAVSPDVDLALTRDPDGRILTESVNGATIAYTYDAAGRRTSRRTPSGADSRWEYDPRGHAVALHAAGHTLQLTHDAAGRHTDTTLTGGAGMHLAQAFDANHRLLTQTLTSGWTPGPDPTGPRGPAGKSQTITHRAYHYREDGLLAAIDDAATGRRTFDLDRAGRITAVTAHGWSERYAYDPAGNLAHATWTGLGSPADGQGNREYAGTLIRRAGGIRYEHDAQGRVVLRQHKQLSAKPLTWRYTYNSDDRLTAVTCPDGTVWAYAYDPLGRRIAKCHYSADGHLLEQTTFCWDGTRLAEQTHWAAPGAAPHATTWDYRPGSFTPIMQTDRHWLATADQHEIDQRFHAIITDLVGAPTELVTPDGRIAWHTQTTIWGTTTSVSTTGVNCPLRFPGQYHDPETGLHYNNQRYYDPATARYTTTDPLGLAPAPNPHTYIPNPTYEIDPLGLAPCEELAVQGEWADPRHITPTHPIWQDSSVLRRYTDQMRQGTFPWDARPINVVRHRGGLYVEDGHHRLQAALAAGVGRVPIHDVTAEMVAAGHNLDSFCTVSLPFHSL